MVGENGLLADLVATAHFGLRGRNAAAAKSKLLSMMGPGLSSDGLGYKTEIAELTNIARQSIVGCEAQGRGDFAGLGFQALWPSPNCPTSAVRGRRSMRHGLGALENPTIACHPAQRSKTLSLTHSLGGRHASTQHGIGSLFHVTGAPRWRPAVAVGRFQAPSTPAISSTGRGSGAGALSWLRHRRARFQGPAPRSKGAAGRQDRN